MQWTLACSGRLFASCELLAFPGRFDLFSNRRLLTGLVIPEIHFYFFRPAELASLVGDVIRQKSLEGIAVSQLGRPASVM